MTSAALELDPEIRAFVASSDRLFDAAYDELPAAQQRDLYNAWCRAWSEPRSAEIETTDFQVPTADGGVPVRLYRRGHQRGGWTQRNLSPVVLYMHGGGWTLGDCDSHDQVTARMALETGTAVLSVNYRLAPEHKFPAAFDDCYNVLTWLATQGAAHGLDSTRLAVAGDSAGGNLAVALALAARDRNGPPIAFQGLIYPALTFQRGTSNSAPVVSDIAGHPLAQGDAAAGLSADAMSAYARAYLARPEEGQNPYASPLLAADFSRLPPAYIAAAWFDVIRSDSEIYAQKLKAAGVPVTYACAMGLPHTYLRTLHFCAAAQHAFSALCQALKKALV